MKYIKPTDFLSVRQLQADYKRIEGEITDLLLTDASARTAAELNDKLQQALNAATRYLAGVNDKFAKIELSTAFKEGKDSVHEKPKLTAKEADAILSAQGFRYSEKAFAKHTYIELQTATENAGKGLKSRVNGIIEGLRKTGNDSVYNVQQAILKDLQQNGLMVVEYANGTKQTLDSYAAMAARSARIESTNIGSIGRALQAGTDLVIMTTMPQCCKLCGAYQDKVYSISGKDKRFPALFKTVLKSGYALPHPNCRHEFIPYFAKAEDPADLERMIKQSRIKYDSKGRLADVRTQTDIELYQAWQAGNRQRNTEMLEYNKMREFYQAKGIDAPYSTLAAFRRARRAQSENYQESRKEWGEKPQEKPSGNDNAAEQQTIPREISEKRLTLWAQSDKMGREPNPNASVDCAVDWRAINTKQHNDALIKLTGNKNVALSIARIEREILTHRDGTEHEDLYMLDARTGRIVDKNTSSTKLLGTGKTEKMERLAKYDDSKEYILVHNHPYSSRPSAGDFNSLFESPRVKYGVIIGHDGTLYKYTRPKEMVIDIAIVAYVKKAQAETGDALLARKIGYQRLAKKYGFTLEEW